MNAQQSAPSRESDRVVHALGSGLVTRRRFMAKAAGGLVAMGLAGLAGYEWPHAAKRSIPAQPDYQALPEVQGFVTRPDLRPPAVRVTTLLGDGSQAGEYDRPRHIFVSPITLTKAPSQPGLMLLDRQGRLIWFKPFTTVTPYDFNAQDYKGQPLLTWWQGRPVTGHGSAGVGEMANSSYRAVGAVHAGDGLREDYHEFNLTTAGTALITAYQSTTTDLSAVGGARRGNVVAGHAQEIDVATGKVLFDWDSLSHVGVEESYVTLPSEKGNGYDYFHINSISEAPDGNLLISARGTWAIYKVDRSSGKVIWRMNGKRSDFTMGPGTHFYWQHDARMPGPATLTLFDNGSDGSLPTQEKQSRALLLSVSTKAMEVSLERAYVHPAGFAAANQGSTQLLADGRVFVGWGNQPYFSEFAPEGTLLLDGEFPPGVRSYRAFTHDWVGHPTEPPSIAVTVAPAGPLVCASWNGATEIASWTVLAGKDRSSLQAVGSQEWTGFETAIAVNSLGPYYAVLALDKNGKQLGRSGIVE
jgi:hypothetical protein